MVARSSQAIDVIFAMDQDGAAADHRSRDATGVSGEVLQCSNASQ
jgi:hypothetical protein